MLYTRMLALGMLIIFLPKFTLSQMGKIISINPYENTNYSFGEVVKDVEYIILENTNSRIFEKTPEVKVSSLRYYLYDRICCSPVLIFNKKGKFLFEINKEGEGPGEYVDMKDIYINENKDILKVVDHIGANAKIITYNLEGKYLNERKIDFNIFEYGKINDDLDVYHTSYLTSRYNSKLIIESLKDKTKKGYFKINPDQNRLIIESASALSQYDEYSYSYIPTLEYTMYRVDSSGIEAKYFFDFGKYQIPDEMFDKNLRIDHFLNEIESKQYVSLLHGVETQGYIVLVFSHNGKRVAFYSKYKDRLYYARDWESSGIALGIKGVITPDYEDILYMVVPAYQMLEMAKKVAQIPANEHNRFHKKLLDISGKISEDSNPVIAKLTLKSQ